MMRPENVIVRRRYFLTVIIFTVLLVIGGCFDYPKTTVLPTIQAISQVQDLLPDNTNYGYIDLWLYNWEAVGARTRINENGDFAVYQLQGTAILAQRKGTLALPGLDKLMRLIEGADFRSVDDEYKGARKTSRLWINYKLTVKTEEYHKSSLFHSEDGTVPKVLNEIVEEILFLTR